MGRLSVVTGCCWLLLVCWDGTRKTWKTRTGVDIDTTGEHNNDRGPWGGLQSDVWVRQVHAGRVVRPIVHAHSHASTADVRRRDSPIHPLRVPPPLSALVLRLSRRRRRPRSRCCSLCLPPCSMAPASDVRSHRKASRRRPQALAPLPTLHHQPSTPSTLPHTCQIDPLFQTNHPTFQPP